MSAQRSLIDRAIQFVPPRLVRVDAPPPVAPGFCCLERPRGALALASALTGRRSRPAIELPLSPRPVGDGPGGPRSKPAGAMLPTRSTIIRLPSQGLLVVSPPPRGERGLLPRV